MPIKSKAHFAELVSAALYQSISQSHSEIELLLSNSTTLT